MSFFLEGRKRLGTLIAIVIGLGLFAFILGDAFNYNTGLFRGNSDVVGVIDGEKIHYKDFNEKVEETINTYKINSRQNSIDDNTTFSLREQAWNQMIQQRINQEEYSALGVTVGDEEFKDLFFGADPYPAVKRSFTNPQTGQFEPMAVKNYISSLDKSLNGEDPVEKRAEWISFEKGVKDDRLSTKYKSLIKNGLYVPKWQAEMEYDANETKYDITYTKVPFTTISDSSVTVTDAEMQAYINKHKEQYKQDESRKVNYVIFTITPSAADTAKARKDIEDAYNHIKENPDDTAFIKMYAQNGWSKFYYSAENITSQRVKDSLLEGGNPGKILAPYFEDGAFKTAKIFDRRAVPDSVKFSLIFITKGTDSVKAKIKADSIYNAVKSGANYEELAMKFSEDKASGERGGDQGYMKQGMTFKDLNDFLFFGGNTGDLKVLNTGTGYIVVKITDKPVPVTAIQYAFFSHKVEASSATDKMTYEQANKFLSANSSSELFNKSFSESNGTLNKQTAESVRKNDFQLPGLTSARELVKWSYNAEKNEVSSIFALDNHYVVACLAEIKPEGIVQLTDDNRPQFVDLVRKEKKGALLAAQINSALAMNSSVESVAAKYSQEVKTATGVTFGSSYIQGAGNEPQLLGAVSALQSGQTTKAVIGNSGVFVATLTNVLKATPIADYSQIKQQIIQSVAPMIEYSLPQTLQKTIKIEDDRYKFF